MNKLLNLISEGLNTSPNYLSTLPFPKYFEEFNINDGDNILDLEDINLWGNVYRPDIQDFIYAYSTIPNFHSQCIEETIEFWQDWGADNQEQTGDEGEGNNEIDELT